MINRVFFITEHILRPEFRLPAEEGVYRAILVNPALREDLECAYREMESRVAATGRDLAAVRYALTPCALTLDLREPLTEDTVRFITSFLFLPAYLRIAQGRVINLVSASDNLLDASAKELLDYLFGQGLRDVVLNKVARCADSPEALGVAYSELLAGDQPYDNDIFFLASSGENLSAALSILRQAEAGFEKAAPATYALILRNRQQADEINSWRRKHEVVTAELANQKQFVDVLRSDHATKELQDFYNNEYEILPLWYKRFGHLIKVVTGKRTLRSLFSDNVKKYKS